MKNYPFKIYFLVLLASAFIPYCIIALVLWDMNMANWNSWVRVGFVIWSLVIANNVFNRIKNNE